MLKLPDGYSVPWYWTNEIFLFDQHGYHRYMPFSQKINSVGKFSLNFHVNFRETKSLLTDSTVASFEYDDMMRLRRVSNKWRSHIEIKYVYHGIILL